MKTQANFSQGTVLRTYWFSLISHHFHCAADEMFDLPLNLSDTLKRF